MVGGDKGDESRGKESQQGPLTVWETAAPAASDLEEASVRRRAEDPGYVILLLLFEPFHPEMTQLPSGAECRQEDSVGPMPL